IAGEHEGFVSDRFDEKMQRLFSAFTTDEDPSSLYVSPDIRADALSRLELDVLFTGIVLDVGFPATVESFEAGLQPRNPGLHETDAKVGKLIENTIEDDPSEGHHLAEGMS